MQNNFNERTIRCTFCDKTSEQVRWLFTSERANICDDCVEKIYEVLKMKKKKSNNEDEGDNISKENKEELNAHINKAQVYEGKEPYIYISYHSESTDFVNKLVEILSQIGYRVWFNSNTTVEENKNSTTAEHILNCNHFIPIISKEYVDSNVCKEELKYAARLKKSITLLYLGTIGLPTDLKLRTMMASEVFVNSGETYEGLVKKLLLAGREMYMCYDFLRLTKKPNELHELFREPFNKLNVKEPYIYISYVNNDEAEACKLAKFLEKEGLNIYNNESAVDEIRVDKIDRCKVFVPLISNFYVGSKALDELNYARDINKDILLIYLEDVSLDKGEQLRIARIPGIYKHKQNNYNQFISNIVSSLHVELMKTDQEE